MLYPPPLRHVFLNGRLLRAADIQVRSRLRAVIAAAHSCLTSAAANCGRLQAFVPGFSFYGYTDCKGPCSRRHGHQDKITMQYAYGTSGYALVSHHLIAHAAFVRKRNSWCGARCLPALLKTNAAFRFHFERSTVAIRIFFSVF